MKRILHASTLFAGSLLSAGLLSAANFSVPFDFEASGKTMPAGTYQVSRVSQIGPVFRLMNRATGKSLLVNFPLQVYDGKAEQPRMVFRCNGADCAVAEFWPEANVGAARVVKQQQPKAVVVDTGL